MEGGLRKPAAEKRSGGVFLPYPLTVAIGDSEEMQKAIAMLGEVKESIINAYEIKTNLSRAKLAHLMDAETWMNANKAIELGFADGILEDEKKSPEAVLSFAFSRRTVTNSLMNKLSAKQKTAQPAILAKPERSVDELMERLNLMKY